MELELPIKISKRRLGSLVKSPAKTAAAIQLTYVSDKEEGITRSRSADGFDYFLGSRPVKDEATLKRIRSLVIPPAWQNVWICKEASGHLQATGMDALNRKQYKYHPHWNQFRNQTKFFHLYSFGKALPAIREQLQKHIALPGLPLEKVLAAVIMIMEQTTIRIGNSAYEKLYGSFGLTTLKDKHVHINGSKVDFAFKGKKGVYHKIELKSRKLAYIIKQCRDIPGKELFQYYTPSGERKTIDSGMVNEYIKRVSNGDFTAKDFRTWTGTVQALLKLREFGCCETAAETKKRIVEVLDHVAEHLGNTRTVCKKYYVHPIILDLYTNRALEKYWKTTHESESPSDLKPEEKMLMKILESN